ncbi:MAG: NADH:ubiquinone reductase (Na(+)-transporting) subunit B, partial [Proteobacteria bacterium]|nr:NADH:ubiquinone reductase (Na(+)-transporting) subunit B [Pseudomonadota bacterium]
MARLRTWLDHLERHFVKGGRYEKYGALFEMVDTLLYSPKDLTRSAPHVRDAADLKRVMFFVVIAAAPCVLMAFWNTGYQANLAMAELGLRSAAGWRGAALDLFAVGYDPANVLACALHGLLYFLPIYAVTLAVGGAWEVLFATVRNHEVNEGFLVTSLLYALILPPDIPFWQVALGISFGVVIGKELFGGTGKNILNPALLGRAFLYFAYPAEISGDAVWVAVDGYSGATALALGAERGVAGITSTGITWMRAFLGSIPGSLGETSTLASLIGGGLLVVTGVASWRIIVGVFA